MSRARGHRRTLLTEIARRRPGLFAEQARQQGVDLADMSDTACAHGRGDRCASPRSSTNLVNNAAEGSPPAGSVKLAIGSEAIP